MRKPVQRVRDYTSAEHIYIRATHIDGDESARLQFSNGREFLTLAVSREGAQEIHDALQEMLEDWA